MLRNTFGTFFFIDRLHIFFCTFFCRIIIFENRRSTSLGTFGPSVRTKGCPAVNCSFVELNVFAQQLGLVQETLPPAIALLCEQPAVDLAVTGKGDSLSGACS